MAGEREGLNHRLPLNRFDVEISLPRDLTEAEATRLGEWISALVSPWSAPPPAPPKEAPECETCGDGLFVGSTTLGTLRPCPDCAPKEAEGAACPECGSENTCDDLVRSCSACATDTVLHTVRASRASGRGR